MTNKPTKPIKLSPKMTKEQLEEITKRQEEEKKLQALQQLAQRRESIAVNILLQLCHAANQRVVATMDSTKVTVDTKGLVALSVEMADELMMTLYGQNVKEVKK